MHSIHAVRFDMISSVGRPITERVERLVPEVLEQWHKLVGVCRKRDQGSYAAGWSRYDARWRTLMGNLVLKDGDDPSRQALPEDRGILRRPMCGNHDLSRWVAGFCESTLNQAFFMIPTGYMGIGPRTTRPRDEFWLLFGGRVRSVLRALEEKSTNLDATTEGDAGKEVMRERSVKVGGSSAHGIMQGEPEDRYDEKRRTTLLM
jgi:hypothetical protein